jgi:hypothetical protein
MPRSGLVRGALPRDLDDGVQRVAEAHWRFEIPLHRKKRHDGAFEEIEAGGKAECHADRHRPVRDTAAEIRHRGEDLIDVQRIEIAGASSEADNVGFRDGVRRREWPRFHMLFSSAYAAVMGLIPPLARRVFPPTSDLQVVEMHRSAPPTNRLVPTCGLFAG